MNGGRHRPEAFRTVRQKTVVHPGGRLFEVLQQRRKVRVGPFQRRKTIAQPPVEGRGQFPVALGVKPCKRIAGVKRPSDEVGLLGSELDRKARSGTVARWAKTARSSL